MVDVDRTYTDSTNYSLEDWAEGNDDGIIGTQVWENSIVRDEGDTGDGGAAGTTTNADLNTYVTEQVQPDGNETVISTSGETSHLVDTEKQQVEHLAGYISDVTVSVTINQNAAVGVEEDQLYPHVARAAGISQADQESKISILIAPFYQEETPDGDVQEQVPSWVLYAAIGGGVLFLVLLLVMFLLHRRRMKKRQAAAQGTVEPIVPEQIPVPQQADIMEMNTEKSMELRRDVRRFAEDNPEIAAQMVKNWLREGDRTS